MNYFNKPPVPVNGQKSRDWRMPTQFELNEMDAQQAVIGGFSPSFYWSSTEVGYDIGWTQDLGLGYQYGDGKFAYIYVRSVRAF
ncbi:DUF1566 domain-containing protein [Crocinitomicaceae bacterium]|nr:DUF1566 domain-containing protein [Crocinitomicaceae bacterium]